MPIEDITGRWDIVTTTKFIIKIMSVFLCPASTFPAKRVSQSAITSAWHNCRKKNRN